MDLQLASHIIGRVEPQRHDNRLHLIVVDQPVEFMGEMEIFRLTAPGKGTYRIEAFVLLHERPAPSSFAPEIQDVTVRRTGENEREQAHLHFTTSRVARTEVALSALDGDYRSSLTGAPARLHHLCFSDLPTAGSACEFTITATDDFGSSAQKTYPLASAGGITTAADGICVPLDLFNLQRADLAGLPLTFGVPFARGAIQQIDAAQLSCAGAHLTARAKILSRWDDGSARWASLETSTPSALSEAREIAASQSYISSGGAFRARYR